MRWLMLLGLLVLAVPLTAAECGGETGIGLAAYDLVSLPGQQDFGPVAVGMELSATLTLTNRGNGSASIANITLGGSGGGHFVLPASFDGDIGANSSHDIAVVFAPQAEGYWEETLIVAIRTTEGSDVLEVPLRGRGVLAALRAWPELLDFGPVPDGEDADDAITVENLTGVDVEIWNFAIEGEADGFDVEAPFEFPVYPWVVEANGTLDLTVTYAAHDAESREATLGLLGPEGLDWGVAVDLRANLCDESAHPGWDSDMDGVTVCGGDCNDVEDADSNGSAIHPGAPELPDLLDNDCDGIVDEGTILYDNDGDGQSAAGGDCDDTNPTTWAGAEEVADGQDNDCDGDVDEGTTADDSDGDGYTIPAGDCDDTSALTWPGAQEVVDGLDNDCDSAIDDTTSVYDDDGDGYCEDPALCLGGWTPGDCNDGDAGACPGNAEVVNGVDDDCDGVVDNGTGAADDDGDGYSEQGGDCNDGDALVFPGAAEIADSTDNDCDGLTDEGTSYVDDDGDGFTETGGDCNDSDDMIYPGAAEDGYAAAPFQGDGIDNNCNGTVDEGTSFHDDDGDGFSEQGGDCDDNDNAYSPAVYDPPGDGDDWDCDGAD